MAVKQWMKLYTEILEDPKMGRLSDRLFRRVIEIFLLARKTSEDGSLPSVSDMAWSFRISENEMLADLEALALPGVEIVCLDEDSGKWYVTNFEERQEVEISASTERVRRFRKIHREIPTSETVNETKSLALQSVSGNVTETLHETTIREEEEKEKEEEKEEKESREESRARASKQQIQEISLRDEIAVVMGVPQGAEAVAAIRELEKMGAEPVDIREAAAWYAEKKKTIRTVDQLIGPVKTAILQRKQKNNGHFKEPSRNKTVADWLGFQT